MSDATPSTLLDRWLEVLETEYLDTFIRSGGAAVKFITADDSVLAETTARIAAAANTGGYYYAFVDPSTPALDGKPPALHKIDKLFVEITKQFDWTRWAREQALLYLTNAGIEVPAGCDISGVDRIAEHNGRDAQDLIAQYQREFATPQLRDNRLSIEFRAAITALGRAQLIPDALSPTTAEVLLEWFHGRTMPGAASALKKVQIYERINTSNARSMLTSFCRWLQHAGHHGLVAVLDFRPYEYKRISKSKRQEELIKRLQDVARDGRSNETYSDLLSQYEREVPPVAYSDAAYTQMLTILRRFIDEVDTFDNMMLIVLTSPGFYRDKTLDESVERCYFDYDALQTRIGQEVHDAHRSNLAASLVHLGGSK